MVVASVDGTIRVHDTSRISSGSGSGSGRGGNSKGATKEVTLKAHTGPVECVKYDMERHRIVSTGEDKKLKFWDLRASRATHTIPLQAHSLNISVHPSSKSLVVGDFDCTLTRVDLAQMEISGSYLMRVSSQ